MLYSKAHFAVRHAASKDSTRHSLNGIHFKSDGSTEATDGHWLLQVKAEVPPDDEWPSAMGCGIKSSDEKLEPFVLPLEACDAIAKAIPKRNTRSMPVLSHAALDVVETNANGSARFVTTDLATTTPVEAQKVDGVYPSTEQVVPNLGDMTLAFAVDLALLAKVAKAAKEVRAANGGDTVALGARFYVNSLGPDAMSPIRIELYDKGGSGDTMTAIVMPMRLKSGPGMS